MNENFVWIQVVFVIIRYGLQSLVVYLAIFGVSEEMQNSLVDEIANAAVPVIVQGVVLLWSIAQKRYANAMIHGAQAATAGTPLKTVADDVKLTLSSSV